MNWRSTVGFVCRSVRVATLTDDRQRDNRQRDDTIDNELDALFRLVPKVKRVMARMRASS